MGRNVSIIYTKAYSGYSTVFKLLSCCQKIHQVIQSLLHIKRMACTSPLIHQSVSDGYTSQTGSTADVNACSDNELVDDENHKNEARFTFS